MKAKMKKSIPDFITNLLTLKILKWLLNPQW